jgi:uncharacterized lipoprotein YmbA
MKTNTVADNSTPAGPRPRRCTAAGLLLGLVLAASAGCSILPKPTDDPTRYYLLSEPLAARQTETTTPHGTVHLGLRAVDLPTYLRNSRTLVLRRAANEVSYLEFARWAEPLDAAVGRLVREKLLASEKVASADPAPFSSTTRRDLDLSIRVVRCEGALDENGAPVVVFVAGYELLDPKKGGEVILRRNFVAPAARWDGSDYGQLVQRLSDAVAALGDDIAQNLPQTRS